MQVKKLSQDIQSNGMIEPSVWVNYVEGITVAGGPLSISKELAQMFDLEGVREVCVKKVEKDAVGLDLVELKFKVCPLWSWEGEGINP